MKAQGGKVVQKVIVQKTGKTEINIPQQQSFSSGRQKKNSVDIQQHLVLEKYAAPPQAMAKA